MSNEIKDEFTKLKGRVSRQWIWQLRQKKRGLCTKCNKRAFTKNLCFTHAKKDVIAHKKKYGGSHTKSVNKYEPYGKRSS